MITWPPYINKISKREIERVNNFEDISISKHLASIAALRETEYIIGTGH